VSSKVASLETEEALLSRLDEAASYLDPSRLALSPQCGFASTLKCNAVTEEEQWRKLELVVKTARRFWA
jgi:5-methyltetrahydropteroyltriglutamate--homocysteine methyltransferase